MHVVKPSGLGDRGSDDPGFVADRSDRFTALIQSPLRASLLRHLHQRPEVRFSLDALAQHFARLPQDVQNCLDDLVEAGLVRASEGWFEAENSGGWGPLIDALLKRPVRTSVCEASLTGCPASSGTTTSPARARLMLHCGSRSGGHLKF